VGGIDDPAHKVGLAQFTAAMLRQGTRRNAADQISARVDEVGASLESESGYEVSRVGCSGRAQTLELCLELMGELLSEAAFPEKELGEVRDQLLGSIKQARDDPPTLALMHFENMLYGDDHPGGRPMTPASVSNITRKELKAFYRRHYLPNQAILVLSGSFPLASTKRNVEQRFKRWRRGNVPQRRIAPVKDPAPGIRVLLIDKPDLTQSFFALGHAGIRRKDPARDAVQLMNYVLGGGGFSSRLMKVVRSQGGKTYGISSTYDLATFDGSFSIRSFTRTAETVATLQLIRQELKRFLTEPPAPDEIEQAKGKIAGGYAIRFQTPGALGRALATAKVHGFDDTYVSDYALHVQALTRDAIVSAARQHLRPESLVVAIVGRAEAVEEQLKAVGIAYEKISYLDPIGARERKAASSASAVTISVGEARQARRILERAIEAAGGLERLSGIKSLRLIGRAKMGDTVEGGYLALVIPPTHLRLVLSTTGMGEMTQVLAGERAFVQAGTRRQDLPAALAKRMSGVIWREPTLILRNLSDKAVRLRRSKRKLGQGLVALEAHLPGTSQPLLVAFEQKTHFLREIHFVNANGVAQRLELSEHKKVLNILVPHQITVHTTPRQQITYTKVEINPAITTKEVVGE
jgi:zinc protease